MNSLQLLHTHAHHTHTTYTTHIRTHVHTHYKQHLPHTTHLDMPLWLHESSHHSKTSEQVSTCGMCSHSWYDGVIGTFTGGQDVRVPWVKGEVGSSVLYTSTIEKRPLTFRGRHTHDTAESPSPDWASCTVHLAPLHQRCICT